MDPVTLAVLKGRLEQIADEIGKTVGGVKTMLTRRGLACADYDGAARKEKASS